MAPASMPAVAADPEAEQGTDGGAQALRLLDRQVAPLQGGQAAVQVLLHGEGVDEADHVVLPEPAELLKDLPGEVRLVEADD